MRKKYYEVWNEHIHIGELLIGIAIALAMVFLALLFAKTKAQQLLYGLIAITVSFVVNSLWIKPKRNVVIE